MMGRLQNIWRMLNRSSQPMSTYFKPRIIEEGVDQRGYPVLTVAAPHSQHVADMLKGTTYPGAVYRRVTKVKKNLYKVKIVPFDTEGLEE